MTIYLTPSERQKLLVGALKGFNQVAYRMPPKRAADIDCLRASLSNMLHEDRLDAELRDVELFREFVPQDDEDDKMKNVSYRK